MAWYASATSFLAVASATTTTPHLQMPSVRAGSRAPCSRAGCGPALPSPPEAAFFLPTDDYAFMGTLIIQEVVRELLDRGLAGGKVLLLAGSR